MKNEVKVFKRILSLLILGLFCAVSSIYATGAFSITKTASEANPVAGDTLTYTISYTCIGNCYNVQVVDTIPAQITGVTGTPAPLATGNVWSWGGVGGAYSMTNSATTISWWGTVGSYTIVGITNTAEIFGTQSGDSTSTTILAMATLTFTASPTFTKTATKTITSTITCTPTYTATPSYFQVRFDGYAGWIADQIGDTNGAVTNYYKKATDCAGRGDTVGEAQSYFSAGHSQVRKFNATSNYNQTLKAIRLMLTPSAQVTAGYNYAVSLTTSYTPLLTNATNDLNNAAALTGTSKAASDAVNNKLKNDYNVINAVATWVATNI